MCEYSHKPIADAAPVADESGALEAAGKLWLAAGRSYGHEAVSQVTSSFAFKLIYV